MKSVPHFVFVRIYALRLKTCGFLRFYILFSIFVSSFAVRLYSSHSSAENFRSKSRRPWDRVIQAYDQKNTPRACSLISFVVAKGILVV